MKRQNLVLVAVAALLGSALAGTALARDGDSNRDRGWNGDRGHFRAMTLEGRWVLDDRDASAGQGRGGYGGRFLRDVELPNRIQIDRQPSLVRITDGRNNPLQVITLGGKFDTRRGDGRPDYVAGRFQGSTLVVDHRGPRGGTITQTFALENRGRTLVVTTRREGFGPRTVEITSTYRRA